MSFIVHDYKCDECEDRLEDHFVRRSEMEKVPCPSCGNTMRILPCKTRVDWDSLARGDNASPEAIRHFERKRKQQAAKESKSMKEHGDRGRTPGS